MATSATAQRTLRTIALSRIVPAEDFNPRGRIEEDSSLVQLANTMRRRGQLQPVRVRETGTGDFVLIAGERRYRAALLAAMTELDAVVLPPGAGDRAEEVELLADAVVENFARRELDCVQEARGFQALRDAGLTIRGIAEELGGVPVARVRDRLGMLRLPEALWPRFADGTVPVTAVKPLAALAKVDARLPDVAVARVLTRPAQGWRPQPSWADLASDPIGLVCAEHGASGTALPDGVYDASDAIDVAALPLAEEARSALAESTSGDAPTRARVWLDSEQLDQVRALGALHEGKERSALIVGDDVVAQIVGDALIAARDRRRAQAATETSQAAGEPSGEPGDDAGEVEARRRADREAEREARVAAQAFNVELGGAVLRHLAKVKVDGAVLRIVAAIDFGGELGEIAERGARYGMPGWTTETAGRGGSKVEFLDRQQAAAKAREFLAGASTVPEHAGRLLCLLAMARYADQAAVARSRRSNYELRASIGLPWGPDVTDELDELCASRLPEHLTDRVRSARKAQREREAHRSAERDAATVRIEERRGRLAELTDAEQQALLADAAFVWGEYSGNTWELRSALRTLAKENDTATVA